MILATKLAKDILDHKICPLCNYICEVENTLGTARIECRECYDFYTIVQYSRINYIRCDLSYIDKKIQYFAQEDFCNCVVTYGVTKIYDCYISKPIIEIEKFILPQCLEKYYIVKLVDRLLDLSIYG